MYFLFVNRIKPDTRPEALREVITDHARWLALQLAEGNIVQAADASLLKRHGGSAFKSPEVHHV